MSLTIGVDVGGTKVAAGVVDEEGKILASDRRDTPARSVQGVIDTIVSAVQALRTEHDVEAVGIGMPGFVDETRSRVLVAPNLRGWKDQPLRVQMEASLGLPVVVENDANAAAWGEVVYGAGRGEDYVVCVTVGTGVGGGIIMGGELIRGRFGVAAEIGHIEMVPDGRLCGCGQRGCWEQYASGNALVRDARERASEDRFAAAQMLALGDGTPEGIRGEHVTEAAQAGDPVALAAFSELGWRLAEGMADLAAVLDPGLFVLGGGVSEAGELLLNPVRVNYVEQLTGGFGRTIAPVKVAELGNSAGMVGVADLARRR